MRNHDCLPVDRPSILDDCRLLSRIPFDRLADFENIPGKDFADLGVTVAGLVNQLSNEDEPGLFQKVLPSNRKNRGITKFT